MHRWRVQVSSSDPYLLPYLATSLQNASDRILEEDGHYYLISSSFESYQSLTEFQELSACADRIIARLNSLLKLQFQVHTGIVKTNPAIYVDDSGLQHLVVMETIRLTDEVRGYVGDNFFQDASRSRPELITRWLEEGNDPSVDEALRYYADEVNWFNLYKVYEVIEHDIRSRQVDLALLKQDKAEDFTYSANNFTASKYDARHSSKKFERTSSKPTKRTAMSLKDAKYFIDDLLKQWLNTKL